MEIANATAAGPSYGILDVLFGSKPEESAEADGQEMMPFMNLIKALKEQSSDKESSSSWTEEETASGKSAVEYGAVGMPGMFPPSGGAMEQLVKKESAKEGVSLETLLAKKAELPKLKTIDPKLVNGMLEASSLLPLTKEEQKLLTEVNRKIEEQNSVISGISGEKALRETVENSEAALAQNDPESAQFIKELKSRGINPEGLRGAESKEQAVAPEKSGKFLSTESYLQIHEKFTKPAAKTAGETDNGKDSDTAMPLPMAREGRLESSPISGGDKGKDFLGNPEKNLLSELKPKGAVAKQEQGLNFAAGLMDALKHSSDSEIKELQLPANPVEAKSILTGEVNQNVNLQALKGGGEMRLIIYPEQMGEVKLHVGANNGKVEVKITAENEEVAKVIRSGSKDLEVSLRDQNLSLTKFDVSVADSAVSSLDNSKGSLSDQFLQQQGSQQNLTGFSGRDDGQASKWNGNGSNRENPGGFAARENENSRDYHSSSSSKNSSRVKDSSRKLDVVA